MEVPDEQADRPARDPAALDRMPYVFKAGIGYDTGKIFAAMKSAIGLY
jgi:hypothetical protein